MSPRLSATLVALLLLGAVAPAVAVPPALRCTAPVEVTRFKVTLPHTARAIRRGEGLVIVAIGSSSTQGVGASDPAHTYPALLAEELQRRWPRLAVTVVNQGVGGEMAEQMLARFTRDVLPYYPQLVIWQTGSNHALEREDVQSYEKTIRTGIARLKAAHMDVILMDPQYAPRVLRRPLHRAIVDTIGGVSNDLKVAVFRRFAVMRHWVTSGQYKMQDIISHDQLHMNNASYHCIARLLADSLASAALATPPSQTDDPIPTGSAWRARMPTTLVQQQHAFDGFLPQPAFLPLPPGEGRGEGPQRLVKAPHPNPLPGGRALRPSADTVAPRALRPCADTVAEEGTDGTSQNQRDNAPGEP